jgi:Porin subfamily
VDCRIARGCSILQAAAVLAAMLPMTFLASGVVAQTLTDPNRPAKWSPPQAPAKSRPTAPVKSCSAYGAGFINVPGTDTCIKIGGWVTVEGSAGR